MRHAGDLYQTQAEGSCSSTELAYLVTVARARILARNRHLEQAEDLLLPLASRAKAPAEVLDLLARVCVHQGKAAEARALWLRMLNDDPGNTHVLRALLKCATLERVMTKKPSFIRLLFWLRMRCWSR